MKKSILLIEDHYVTLDTTACELRSGGYDVTLVTGIAAAEDFFPGKEMAKSFDCVIFDLNMENTYLRTYDSTGAVDVVNTDILVKKTHNGSLTGWVWWYNIAKSKFINNPKIIIYSAFTGELEHEMIRTDDFAVSGAEREYLKKSVEIVSKEASNGGDIMLLEKLKELFSKKGGGYYVKKKFE